MDNLAALLFILLFLTNSVSYLLFVSRAKKLNKEITYYREWMEWYKKEYEVLKEWTERNKKWIPRYE